MGSAQFHGRRTRSAVSGRAAGLVPGSGQRQRRAGAGAAATSGAGSGAATSIRAGSGAACGTAAGLAAEQQRAQARVSLEGPAAVQGKEKKERPTPVSRRALRGALINEDHRWQAVGGGTGPQARLKARSTTRVNGASDSFIHSCAHDAPAPQPCVAPSRHRSRAGRRRRPPLGCGPQNTNNKRQATKW